MSTRGIYVPRSFLPSGSFTDFPKESIPEIDLEMASSPTVLPPSPLVARLALQSLYERKPYPQLQKEIIGLSISSDSDTSTTTVAPSNIVVCKHKFSREPKLLIFNNQKRTTTTKKTAETCHCTMKKIDNFCRDVFQRRPVENDIKAMISELKNSQCTNNAVWVPQQELVSIGATNPRIFRRSFAEDEDILSHEFGHAVIQFSGGLRYIDQSGALNESLADIFAIMRKQYFNKQNANAPDTSWILAENIFLNERNRRNGLRSFKNPGSAYWLNDIDKDLQVKHMNYYVNSGKYDNGGVHINSGILNHAFYLAATREQGYSWEKIGRIWIKALDECSKPDVTFSQFAQKTLTIAKNEYGADIQNIVGLAWSGVGIVS